MSNLYIQAITTCGCCVYTEISLPEDYTMNMVVNEVRRDEENNSSRIRAQEYTSELL